MKILFWLVVGLVVGLCLGFWVIRADALGFSKDDPTPRVSITRVYPYWKPVVFTRTENRWNDYTILGFGYRVGTKSSFYLERKFSLDPSPNVTEFGVRLNLR